MGLRHVGAAAAAVVAFGVVAVALLAVLPEPHRAVEYFLAGGVGTLAALAVFFLAVARSWTDVFFKRRGAGKSAE